MQNHIFVANELFAKKNSSNCTFKYTIKIYSSKSQEIT